MSKHAGNSKAGKNKERCKEYVRSKRRFLNKCKRVARSSGEAELKRYIANYHECVRYTRRVH
jgi:hypothetical protein